MLVAILQRTSLSILYYYGFLRTWIYLGLFSAWAVSIRQRIMQKNLRHYLYLCAMLIILFIYLRTVRYFFVEKQTALSLILWYSYYISLIFLPLMVFFVSLTVGNPESYKIPKSWYLLVIPALVILILILTNNIHQLAFRLPPGFNTTTRQYHYGPVYWTAVVWIGVLGIVSLIILLRKSYVPERKLFGLPFLVLFAGLGYSLLYILRVPVIFQSDMPVTVSLITILMLESCIQGGLIPANTHYRELLEASSLTIFIADESYQICFSSRTTPQPPVEIMKKAEKAPVELDTDNRLLSVPISGGHVMWSEDISAVRRILLELNEAKVQLAEENELLQAEVVLKEKTARVKEQNRLYEIIARTVSRQLAEIEETLREPVRSEEEFRARLARVCVIGAYVKRRSNLILIGDNRKVLPVAELYYCLKESAEYLKVSGIACFFDHREEGTAASTILQLMYDIFEEAIEASLATLTSLLMILKTSEEGLYFRLEAETKADFSIKDRQEQLISLGGQAELEKDGTTRYLTLRFVKGGESR